MENVVHFSLAFDLDDHNTICEDLFLDSNLWFVNDR